MTASSFTHLANFSGPQLATHASYAATRLDIEVVEQTGSTNADLLSRLSELQRPVCRLAHRQTAGRGRAGRQWIAPAGGALTLSLAWQFHRPMRALTGLPLAIGLGIAQTLQRFGIDVELKWPNDVLKDGAKLAGVLVETATAAATDDAVWAVIGAGINLSLSPDERQRLDRPVADLQELRPEAVLPLAGSLLDELTAALERFDREGFASFAPAWNGLHAHAGRRVDILNGERILHSGVARGVDESGRLLLETDTGPIAIVSGEVSLRTGQSG